MLLPPEIWIIIFRWATLEELGTFDYSPLDALSDENRSWSFSYTAFYLGASSSYRKALGTKISLVSVCRRWRPLTTPFLYEHLRIYSVHQWNCLAAALSSSVIPLTEKTRDENVTLFGSHTRRLDITNFPRQWISRTDGSNQETICISVAERVLSSLTRLEILSIANMKGGGDAPDEDATAAMLIARHCGKTVRHLCWTAFNITPSISNHNPDKLEVLDLWMERGSWVDKLPILSLPHLHTLAVTGHVAGFLRRMTSWTVPSMRRVVIHALALAEVLPTDQYTAFFDAFGSSITYLKIALLSFDNDLSMIFNKCTSLQALELPTPAHFAIPNAHAHPSLIRICIPIIPSILTGIHVEALEDRLSDILRLRIPSLSYIRMENLTTKRFAKHGWSPNRVVIWLDLIDQCRSSNIRLEYDDGELLEIPQAIVRIAREG
jgi:hypothetical protein